MLTLKRIVSWLVVVFAATTLVAYWHFLVFHSADAEPPVFFVYSAGVALAAAFVYLVIRLPELWAGRLSWRFSLREVLVVMTIVAAVLGLAAIVWH